MGTICRREILRGVAITAIVVTVGLLTAVQDVEADAACVGRYTDNGDGTVLDNETKLTWQRDADVGLYKWIDAQTYCNNLSLAGGGWRLPELKELHTLVDFSKPGLAINNSVFPNTPSDYFWSATPDAQDVQNQVDIHAWVVDFKSGWVESTIKAGFPHRVRCVR